MFFEKQFFGCTARLFVMVNKLNVGSAHLNTPLTDHTIVCLATLFIRILLGYDFGYDFGFSCRVPSCNKLNQIYFNLGPIHCYLTRSRSFMFHSHRHAMASIFQNYISILQKPTIFFITS